MHGEPRQECYNNFYVAFRKCVLRKTAVSASTAHLAIHTVAFRSKDTDFRKGHSRHRFFTPFNRCEEKLHKHECVEAYTCTDEEAERYWEIMKYSYGYLPQRSPNFLFYRDKHCLFCTPVCKLQASPDVCMLYVCLYSQNDSLLISPFCMSCLNL